MSKQPKQNSYNLFNKQNNLQTPITQTPRIEDGSKTQKPLQNLSNVPTRTQEDQVKRTQPRSPIRQTFEKKTLENKSCIQNQDEKPIPKILQRGKSPQSNQVGRNIQSANQQGYQLEKQPTQLKQQTQFKQNELIPTSQINVVKCEQNRQQVGVQQKQQTKLQIQYNQPKSENNQQQQQLRPKTATTTSQLQLKATVQQDQVKHTQQDQQLRGQQQGKQQLVQNKKQEQAQKTRQQQPLKGEQVVEEKLYKCTEGCGRSFNAKALEKHSKVCKKVFQQKRKVFNSQKQRQIEQEESGQGKSVGMKKQIQKQGLKQQVQKQQQVKNEKPKWKAQSEAFRAIIRQAKGQKLTKEEQVQLNGAMESAQELVQCKFCNRKFNVEAAKKHIVFCETKSKQCGKSGMQKKKK
ncbi:unnamed protein product [Paramecium sonneborni]|uniref:C2HC/C3H-type domain-containing protein n=1 Tax=Paramecium sonneborni TaxID=65129 RepID=A0A8S1PRF3_9CILI|nr:unnamed protein product [Paramecium sonneborni]